MIALTQVDCRIGLGEVGDGADAVVLMEANRKPVQDICVCFLLFCALYAAAAAATTTTTTTTTTTFILWLFWILSGTTRVIQYQKKLKPGS